jgi:hypothetical protein
MPECGDDSGRERSERPSVEQHVAEGQEIKGARSASPPQDHEACARRPAAAIAASAFAADDQAFIDALAAPEAK